MHYLIEKSPGAAQRLFEEAEAPAAYDEAALAQGKSMFRSQCSGCHGGTARGGQGPDLTDDRWIHGDTDEDIKKVIENGIPRTTMKKLGDALSEEQIDKIIAYVRSLANPAGASNWLPYMGGDPVAGEQLFFDEKGQTLCSTCHTVGGRGARIGPTLDRIAARRAPEYIMESILLPSKDISFLYQGVLAVMEDGRLISGIRVNESNFNLQIREQTGRFWSLKKRDLEEFKVLETSIMPENHAEQLTVKQLHDLFAFLMTLE